jgi:hypothetical protein
MKTYTADELLTVAYTAEKLRDITSMLSARDSKEYRDAWYLSDIAFRLRQAADLLPDNPAAAESLMMSIIRPLKND